MGALPSKEPHSDLEYFAPIHVCYTKLEEELISQHNNNVTQIVKSTGVTNGTKSCNSYPRLKIYRNLTLPMIIRRRPSYRKALRGADYIATILQQCTIQGNDTTIEEKNLEVKNEISIGEGIDVKRLMTELRTAYDRKRGDLIKEKPALKVCRRYSKRHTPFEKPNLTTNEGSIKLHEVSGQNVMRSTTNGECEIDIEKLMTDLRFAYESKKNVTMQQKYELFFLKEKSMLKINKRECKRRSPYEKFKSNSAAEINNQNEPAQKQKPKSVLLIEIESKLHNLRKTEYKKVLDIEKPRSIMIYFVSCISPSEGMIKEALLMELKQHLSKNNKD